jgi:predicted nicotinamide N-methyase
VLDHPDLVRGKSVLDLGSGNGIAAIASALAGARRCVANDIDQASLVATRLNASAGSLHVACLERDLLALPPDPSSFDVILAGDMFYERRLADRALRWLREAASNGTLVLAGDPGRTYSPADGIEEVASHDVPVSLEVERETPLRSRVLRIL